MTCKIKSTDRTNDCIYAHLSENIHKLIRFYRLQVQKRFQQIGHNVGHVGEIKQVKILGVIALIDKGETDWKVMSIDINDPMASSLNDIQ